MQEVPVRPAPLDHFVSLLSPERAEQFARYVARGVPLLHGRVVWNVNSTARGGGVAEMLQSLLGYIRAAGVETRWMVLDGDGPFFTLTKRLHNFLHGQPGDGGLLGPSELARYEALQARSAEQLLPLVSRDDVVLLHDPQTVGLVQPLRQAGLRVVWRCHVGADISNEFTEEGWAFLRPFVESADGFVFSRAQYAPGWVPPDRTFVIPPSLDPFSAKNAPLAPDDAAAALSKAGLIDVPTASGSPDFSRRDGTRGTVRSHRTLVLDGHPVRRDARVVLQVSRWDRLKDMSGVMRGFAERIDRLPADVDLMLVGPDVSSVSDDPEGVSVLEECRQSRRELSRPVRDRIHLCGLPMDDLDENAHLVNALQRFASVVVQKSLAEGFGLTVTEPMWKARPVVASAVGGIQDQIEDGRSGLLLHEPDNLETFTDALVGLLQDEQLAERLGAGAHQRVRDRFLADRHLAQYVDLFSRLMEA